jgi:hypothetical protein
MSKSYIMPVTTTLDENYFMRVLFLFILGCIAAINLEAQTTRVDLHQHFANNKLTIYNRIAKPEQQGTRAAIVLNEDVEEGLAVIPGIDFSTGTIEIDLKGQNVLQHSFIGVAFHLTDSNHFDAVYFRPFQFLSNDPVLKGRSIQYISLPGYTWRKLREASPGKYENTIKPIPDPDDWFHATIVVKENEVLVFVNHELSASLTVPILNKHKKGAIALYTADRSGGTFANLSVKPD